MQTYREKAMLSVAATPHTLRHQAATQLARCGDLRVVQPTLGHRRLETCAIYVTPSREDRALHQARGNCPFLDVRSSSLEPVPMPHVR